MSEKEKHFQRVVMILADGAREDVFRQLLSKGDLPHIEQELVRNGSCASGVTTFPSTTGPAYFPFLTGCTPGTLNVPGIRWFDKAAYGDMKKKMVKFRSYCGIETFWINRDIKPVPTVFDLLPNSYSIFNAVCKGAGNRNLTKIMRIWYWYYAHLTDRWEFLDQVALSKTLKALEKDFEFIFVVFPGIDEYSHLINPEDPKTFEQYHFLDEGIGKIAAKLKHLQKWEDTLFWIVSDHGLSATHTHFCVNTFLEKRGLPTFYYPKVLHRKGKQVANMVSGNGMTHLYFKNGKDWKEITSRSSIEKIDAGLLDDLKKEKAVDIVMVRNENDGVDILSKRGEASLHWKGDRLQYQVKSKDPFGYVDVASILDEKQAFDQTKNSDYPDALWQIGSLFKASRTGDIVLSATPGYDLRLKYEVPEHRGSHGSLHKDQMFVPVVTNASLSSKAFRTVDIFPTMLKLLGKPIPAHLDGKVLV